MDSARTSLLLRLVSLDTLKIIVALYIVQFVIVKAYWLLIYPYYVSPLRHLPGPKDHHFIVGQAINQFRSGSPEQPYVSWMRKWPRAHLIRYFTFGHSDAVLVTSLAAHREVLQTKCYSFEKPAFFRRLIADIVGVGVVFAEGEEHKRQRKFLGALFSVANIKAMVPMFQDKARDLTALFDQAVAEEDGVVELVSTYSKIMLDIMGVFALGKELNNLKSSSGSSFHDCYHEVFEPDAMGQVLVAINAFIPIRSWLPLKANKRFVHANAIVHGELGAIVKQRIVDIGERRKKGLDDKSTEVKDLLTYMVEDKYYAEDDDKWTEEDILNQVLTFMAAGHETTASSLVWMTHVFTQYPDITKRLRREIQELLRRTPNPDYSDIESLPYLNNFTRELLRWQCPAISAPREAAEDVIIQGTLIPKGTTVLMMPSVIQRNPTIWGDDCDVFDPDRWDRLSGEATDTHAYAAFEQGPRMCIGKVMTVIEFKAILIEVLSKFEFEAIQTGEVELLNPSPLLRPKGGLKVIAALQQPLNLLCKPVGDFPLYEDKGPNAPIPLSCPTIMRFTAQLVAVIALLGFTVTSSPLENKKLEERQPPFQPRPFPCPPQPPYPPGCYCPPGRLDGCGQIPPPPPRCPDDCLDPCDEYDCDPCYEDECAEEYEECREEEECEEWEWEHSHHHHHHHHWDEDDCDDDDEECWTICEEDDDDCLAAQAAEPVAARE